ncbi:hypothetical protein HIH75_005164 [Escherichia coli]|nr:hypothetical protein [Escherichia coli]EFO0872336.1 hypothetical protein [Escherichia coli O157]EFE7221660.1 hypothetical protein [Escherichia coli]EFJ0083229.1 hypothetical protein [Escherichia coli]EFO0902540.1 hypothetical protein [Escherichia coli O157]
MTFIFCCVYNQIYGYFSPCAFSAQQKTRRSGFSLEAPLVLLFYFKLDSFIQNNSCACFT